MSQGEWGDVVNTSFLFVSNIWWSDFKFLSTADISLNFPQGPNQFVSFIQPTVHIAGHIAKVWYSCLKNDDWSIIKIAVN